MYPRRHGSLSDGGHGGGGGARFAAAAAASPVEPFAEVADGVYGGVYGGGAAEGAGEARPREKGGGGGIFLANEPVDEGGTVRDVLVVDEETEEGERARTEEEPGDRPRFCATNFAAQPPIADA